MTTKVKGILFSVIIIVIALILLPLAIDAVHTVQTDSTTDSFSGVVVAGASADVTLSNDLWLADTDFVTALTATGSGAVPVANSYTSSTNVLNITGLGVDTPQNITATYDYEVNEDYQGVNSITGLVPLLIVVGLILVAIINGLWTLKLGNK